MNSKIYLSDSDFELEIDERMEQIEKTKVKIWLNFDDIEERM